MSAELQQRGALEIAAGVLPAVDIILAAHNEAAYLAVCLESLLAQEYPSELVRIIVADNGSTDATTTIAQHYAVALCHEQTPGAAAARNRALVESTSELVVFLDAHCVVNPQWLRAMVARFTDPHVGGCQAFIDNQARDPRLQRYLLRSGVQANARVLADTVRADRNVYPWILSGNCMYRRSALREAGAFDATLPACEDVDLAWRVVLLGYQLLYVPEAVTVHYNSDRWLSFLGKARRYGRGSAVLARRYLPHGARNAFRPATLWSLDLERSLSALYYWLGYRTESARLAFGLRSQPTVVTDTVHPHFRPRFAWRSGTGPDATLRVSERVIYWLRDDATSVIVHIPSHLRIVLDGAGDFIWRQLAKGRSREEISQSLSHHYGISIVTAEADLDDLIGELVEAGVLKKE